MVLCDLCVGLVPDTNQYRHHETFQDLLSCAQTCELCRLIAQILEKDGNRKSAEEYRETVNNKHELVNDTSITISANRHDLPKKDEDKRKPYQLAISCGPIHRKDHFAEGKTNKAPISILGIYAEEGTKAAEVIATRPVPKTCDTDSAIALMDEWVTKCAKDHNECQLGYMDGKNRVSARTITDMTEQLRVLSKGEETPLPNRVLDLEANGQAGKICLVETRRSGGVYAALSHCWGQSQHLTTTQGTLSQRLNDIAFDDLPKTFQDAISVTRKMGLRFIWIDSLCIIQDSISDWETESSLMGEVYRNAHLTIAAASALDGDGGCFQDRLPSSSQAIQVPFQDPQDPSSVSFWFVHESRGTYSRNVWSGALQQRAWTLQERCLSRRIIHFADDQIYFECNKSLQFEDRRPEAEHSSYYLSFSTLYFIAMHDTPMHQMLMKLLLARQWTTIVESFTARKLTKEEDAMPALSGIATHLFGVCKINYAAGLWLDTILPDLLLWRIMPYDETRQNSRPAAYRAPSWSWISVQGPVLFAQAGLQPLEPGHSSDLLVTADTKVHIDPFGNDPHGRIRSGTLTTTGWLFAVQDLGTLKKKKFDDSDYGHWVSWLGRRQLFQSPNTPLTGHHFVKSIDGTFWGAAAFDDGDFGQHDVFALLVKQKGKTGELQQESLGNDEHLASFLVLYVSPTATNVDEYRRVGMGHLLQLHAVDLPDKKALTII